MGRTVLKTTILALLVLGSPLLARSAQAAICDIKVDPNFPLYMVTVDGEAFKKKRYVDPGDALALRDVLVSSGLCKRATKLMRCSVREGGKGQFVVYRGDIHFDPMAIFKKPGGAQKHARKLASAHLCNFD